MDNNFIQKLKDIQISPHEQKNTLYKYVSIETAEKILSNNTLKFSTVDELNDPHELAIPSLNIRITDKLKKQISNEIITKYGNQNSNIEEHLLSISNDQYYKSLYSELEALRKSIGILCLSKENSNTLMWTHYADNHKGICLGFSLPSVISNLCIAFEVRYENSITANNFLCTDEDDDFFAIAKWIFTKSNNWSYEKEVRAISFEQNGLVTFNKEMLTEVYYGIKTTNENIEKIEKYLRDNRYITQKKGKMTLGSDSYNLSITNI